MRACLSSLAVAVAAASLLPSMVAAQVPVPPVTTGSSGYLFPNDKYQREREGERRPQSQLQRGADTPRTQQSAQPARSADAPIELDAQAQARVKAAIQALVPEYNRRAQRDGEASANAWIKDQAYAIGQREGEIARRNQQR